MALLFVVVLHSIHFWSESHLSCVTLYSCHWLWAAFPKLCAFEIYMTTKYPGRDPGVPSQNGKSMKCNAKCLLSLSVPSNVIYVIGFWV